MLTEAEASVIWDLRVTVILWAEVQLHRLSVPQAGTLQQAWAPHRPCTTIPALESSFLPWGSRNVGRGQCLTQAFMTMSQEMTND